MIRSLYNNVRYLLVGLCVLMAQPAASDTNIIIMPDMSASMHTEYVRAADGACAGVVCATSFAMVQLQMIADALTVMQDPICGNSHISVQYWSEGVTALLGWQVATRASDRHFMAASLRWRVVVPAGNTMQGQAFEHGVRELTLAEATYGIVIMLTDRTVRTDFWTATEGERRAEYLGYVYREIVITNTKTKTELTGELTSLLNQIHQAPFACLG